MHHGVGAGTDEVDHLVRALVDWDEPDIAVAVEDVSAAAGAAEDVADEAEVDIGHTVDVGAVDIRQGDMGLGVGRVDVEATYEVVRPVEGDKVKVAGAGNVAESDQDAMAAMVAVAGTNDEVIDDAEPDQESNAEAAAHRGWAGIADCQDKVLGPDGEGEDHGKHLSALSWDSSEMGDRDRQVTVEADMETGRASV